MVGSESTGDYNLEIQDIRKERDTIKIFFAKCIQYPIIGKLQQSKRRFQRCLACERVLVCQQCCGSLSRSHCIWNFLEQKNCYNALIRIGASNSEAGPEKSIIWSLSWYKKSSEVWLEQKNRDEKHNRKSIEIKSMESKDTVSFSPNRIDDDAVYQCQVRFLFWNMLIFFKVFCFSLRLDITFNSVIKNNGRKIS
jgi:hypothetical protein